jgi:NTE family protein
MILFLGSLVWLPGCSLTQKSNVAQPPTIALPGEDGAEDQSDKNEEFYGPRKASKQADLASEDKWGKKTRPSRLPTIGLVLGPGGARGFAHLGVIKELEAVGIKPKVITGSEFGALVGGIYSVSGNANQLEWELFKLRKKLFLDRPVLSMGSGVAEGKSIFRFLNKYFGNRGIQNFQIKFGTNAIQSKSRELRDFWGGHAATLIRASLAIPGWIKPIRFGGKNWISGAIQDPLPIELARRLGAEFIISVNLLKDPVIQVTEDEEDENSTLQALMGAMHRLANQSAENSDLVLSPSVTGIAWEDFHRRADVIYRGKIAVRRKLSQLKDAIQTWEPPLDPETESGDELAEKDPSTQDKDEE